MMTPATNHDSTETRWGPASGIVALIALVLSILVLTFAWSGARGEPAGLTLAVTGEQQLVDGFLSGAGESLEDIVEIEEVADRDEALTGVEEREYIGALVLEDGAPEVLLASAAGQVPLAVMTEIASRLQGNLDTQIYQALRTAVERSPDPKAALGQLPPALPEVETTDVAAYSEGDPTGAGVIAAGIPLTVGGLLSGIVLAFTVRGRWQRVSAVLGFGITGGLLLALVLTTWLEIYPASFGMVWLVLGTSLAATSGLFVGLHSVLGRPGLGLAGFLTLFAAMPWAAFAVPYAFLPGGLGYFGQWLIPGATSTLTRTVSYFPEAATAQQWWILSCWLLLGLVLTALTKRASNGRRLPQAIPTPA